MTIIRSTYPNGYKRKYKPRVVKGREQRFGSMQTTFTGLYYQEGRLYHACGKELGLRGILVDGFGGESHYFCIACLESVFVPVSAERRIIHK